MVRSPHRGATNSVRRCLRSSICHGRGKASEWRVGKRGDCATAHSAAVGGAFPPPRNAFVKVIWGTKILTFISGKISPSPARILADSPCGNRGKQLKSPDFENKRDNIS